jgi:putative sigma-54 modulation protein
VRTTITGLHVEVTPALRDFVGRKIEGLERIFEGIHSVQVMLDAHQGGQVAEMIVSVSGKVLVVQAEHPDLYAALDLAEDKIKKRLRRLKDRLKDRRVRGARAARW